MATQVKHRRGSTSEIDNFTPAVAEIVVDTGDTSLALGDGVTSGGVKIGKVYSDVTTLKLSKLRSGQSITTSDGARYQVKTEAQAVSDGDELDGTYNVQLANGNWAIFQKPIPVREYDLFVIYGQSNAVGFAGGGDGRRDIPDHAFFWYNRGSSAEWRKLEYDMQGIEGGGAPTTTSTGHAYVEFAREYTARTGRGCLFVPAAYGGLSISELSPGTVHWDALIETLAEIDLDTTYHIANTRMLWCQGESDMTNATSKADYVNSFVALWTAFKAIVGSSYCYISKVGDPRTRLEETRTAIHAAQEEIANKQVDVAIGFSGASGFTVSNGALRTDLTHYTQRGYNLMGRELAKVAAQNDGEVPAISSISARDANDPQFLRTPAEQTHYATVATLTHDGTNWTLEDYTTGRRRLFNISEMSVLSTAIVLNTGTTTDDICTMMAQVNNIGENYGIKVSVRDGTTSGTIVLEFTADTQAVVDTVSGAISYPPLGSAVDTGVLSDLSVDITAGFPKLSYTTHNNIPLVSPVTGGSLTDFIPIAQTASSSNNIWFKYQSTPSETRVLVNFKDKPVDPSNLTLNGLQIDVFAIIGDRVN